MAPSVAATEDVSGHGAGLDKDLKVSAGVSSAGDEKIVVNTIRCLAADLCQQVIKPPVIIGEEADWQYKGGHPGTVMGAATIGIALWRYHMQYNPKNADWLNRDRKPPQKRADQADKQDSFCQSVTPVYCSTSCFISPDIPNGP
jgi:dihydroxyacetone synthase